MVNALEVANAGRQAAHAQLSRMSLALNYIAEVLYHCFVVDWEGSDGE